MLEFMKETLNIISAAEGAKDKEVQQLNYFKLVLEGELRMLKMM